MLQQQTRQNNRPEGVLWMDTSLCGLTGRVVLPSSPQYNEARQGYNRAIQQYPLAIVYCMNEFDVANAVLWARGNSVCIRVRSGGHNYEGYSNGNCTLVIDISEMNAMKLNECEGTLFVQGGVTNRQVYDFVSLRGYPFPGGTCPTVGVSGYASGGGWGLSCRLLGLGCDSLMEIRLVNCDGEVITVNRDCNSDLFWACRGAGGSNFGIITAMVFRLPCKVERVTLIEIDYLHVSSEEQVRFLQVWQHWLKSADERMTLLARIYNSPADGLAMLVRGFFYGDKEEAKKILKCFLTLEHAEYGLEFVGFLKAVSIIGSGYPPFEKFQSVSRFVLKDLTEEDCEMLVDIVRCPPKGSVFAGISLYALGGKVAEAGADETAFFYRNAEYILWLETVWDETRFAQENRNWVHMWFPCFAKVTDGSYVNFPYNKLECYLENYYGMHARLLRIIKRKYDPCNVFTFPQGIGSKGDPDRFSMEEESVEGFDESLSGGQDVYNHRGYRYVNKAH